ncbi:hypothetical protein [Priestia megaterium]|uniref:hypothetical protein n=1 Tax=Priestia megaterium TaxID=1404 RepID=UPI00398FD720
MNIFLYDEQTIQEAVRHLQLIFIYHPKTLLTSTVGFSFLSCIRYTRLVNIMSLSGTQPKKEPLSPKGFDEVTVSTLCSFLYIVDITTIFFQVIEEMMNKKRTFYSYAPFRKDSI